jgi:hypothetical protein
LELEHFVPTRGIERGLEFHAELTEIKPERTSKHQILPEPLVYQEVQSDELRRRRGQAIQGNGVPFKRVKLINCLTVLIYCYLGCNVL